MEDQRIFFTGQFAPVFCRNGDLTRERFALDAEFGRCCCVRAYESSSSICENAKSTTSCRLAVSEYAYDWCRVRVYDVIDDDNQTLALELTEHWKTIRGLAIVSSSDVFAHQRIVSGTEAYCVLVFDGETGRRIHTLPDPPMSAFSVVPVGKTVQNEVVVGGMQPGLMKYDLQRGERVWVCGDARFSMMDMSYDCHRDLLYCICPDRTIRVLDLNSESHRIDISCRVAESGCRCYFDAGEHENRLLLGLRNGTMMEFDVRNLEESVREHERACPESVLAIDHVHDDIFVLGCRGGSVRLWDATEQSVVGRCMVGGDCLDVSVFPN